MALKIGELAKCAGITVRTLHHYDAIGLLRPSRRSESGFRLYSEADADKLKVIQALKQFGCPLSDIGEFLANPEASLAAVITRRADALDEEIRRARALRDRLYRLKEQIEVRGASAAVDWPKILEVMTMFEKYFSREELDFLRSRKMEGNLEEKWRGMVADLRGLMERGVDPHAEEAREAGRQWVRLVRDATGNDPRIAAKLKAIHSENDGTPLPYGITPEMVDYASRAFASAWGAMLAKYVSPTELQTVLARRAAHASEWPPLIAEARGLMERHAALDATETRDLALRWEELFRKAYSGDDRELEAKIRGAFQSEPDLLANIGIDLPLRMFVREAIMHLPTRTRVAEAAHSNLGPKPSAMRVAIFRAAHQLLDNPLILEDPLALKILGEVEEARLRANLAVYDAPLLRGLRASTVLRSRLAEDEWAEAKLRGVRQYVILGAGLDTFAYRNPEPDVGKVFEVDFPETQQWKRECLREAGIAEPESLVFAPIDFERATLVEALEQVGFRADEPAFFSWLGVTMYLPEEAVMAVLRFVASHPSGSGIVFDYGVHPSRLTERELAGMRAVMARTTERGEPWKTQFDPDVLTGELLSMGFRKVRNYTSEEINAKCLAGRTDGLRKSGVSRLVCAEV